MIRNDRFREGNPDILSKLWLGLRCKRPTKLAKPYFQKTWYLNKRTGAAGKNSHVVLRAIPSLTPVLDIELMSDHDNNGNDNSPITCAPLSVVPKMGNSAQLEMCL